MKRTDSILGFVASIASLLGSKGQAVGQIPVDLDRYYK